MGVYIGLTCLILLLGSFFANQRLDKNNLVFYILSGISLIVISAFRSWSVGADTLNYINLYRYANNASVENLLFGYQGVDRGYLLYTKFLNNFSESGQFLLFVNSVIIVFSIFYFIYKNSNNDVLSVYLFLTLSQYLTSMNITRQYLVISIFVFAYEMLKKNKFTIYILLILLASTIHSTALIFLILVPIIWLKPTYKNLLRLLPIMGAVTIILYLNPTIIFSVAGSYSDYIGTQFFQSVDVGGTIVIWIVQFLLVIFGIMILKNKELNDEVSIRIFISSFMVFASICVGLLGSQIYLLFRLNYYFDLFMLLLIPDVIFYLVKEKNLARFIIYSLLFIYFVYNLLNGIAGAVPYEFIWQM